MPSPTLFPLNEPLTPSPDRDEPVLWLKQLVVLPELLSDSPIRDVPFRRGLNIVQTRRRPADERQVVGHSVGKTLLMRLIRYTLGEQHFAIADVRVRIANKFETAQVVAHWRVSGVNWIVVRPMQEARSAKSFAVKSDDWRAAIRDGQAHQPLSTFLTAVSDATLSGLSEFSLPRARRSPKWLDVLGWLARDYECGYRSSNEWRHEDADSGPALDRDDNSVVLQWLAGLMGTEEITLKHRHQEMLDERQRVRSRRDSAQKAVEVIGPSLFSKLEFPSDQEAVDDKEGLFAARVVETAAEKIASLTRLKNERLEQSSLDTLESAEEVARDELIAAEVEVRTSLNQIILVEGRIASIEKADSPSSYALRSPYEDCPSQSCPMRLENRPVPQTDPSKDQYLESLREELADYKVSLPSKQDQVGRLQTALAGARLQVNAERDRLSSETAGIDRDIGRWQSYKKDAESYQAARKALNDSTTDIESLDRKIEVSNQAQDDVRQALQVRLNRLSACYDQRLKNVFGEQAGGRITVDGKGLHPIPDNRLAPNGAALSIMTTVLAFDISSVAASLAGIGHHPRFLLHDSPREGDMEEPLFHSLFHEVRSLESLFVEHEPSFQYIITTTTSPPPELADEAGPFVRLTLDARSEAGHLLGATF